MISLKIDVTKIQKDRLYKGKNGKYLDAILIATPDNEYGNDWMVVQSVTKEERDRGVKGPIIGNAKDLVRQKPKATRAASVVPDTAGDDPNDPGDDVPF